jgi:hypothetical protein
LYKHTEILQVWLSILQPLARYSSFSTINF